MLERVFMLVAKLPNAWARRLGQVLGLLIFYIPNNEKRTATTNIALCYPHLSDDEQKAFVKKTLQENAKTLLELPKIFTHSGQFAIDLITEVSGLEHLKNAIEQKQGIILMVPHLGNWELVTHYVNQYSPLMAMFSPPKQAFLDKMMRKGRESTGAILVPADKRGIRALLKQVKQGGMIGILPDQVPSQDNSGVFAPFMGQSAFTMTLVNSLAKRSGAALLMSFVKRTENGYCIYFLKADKRIADADIHLATQALNQEIEQCVAIAPTQYQWTYKRFKKQPSPEQSPYLR